MGLNKRLLGIEADEKRKIVDLDGMVNEWATKLVQTLRTNAHKKGITITKELISNIRYSIDDGDPPSVSIIFPEHGRFLDMKQLFWHKPPPFEKIYKWVKYYGVNNFGYVPGYEHNGARALYELDKEKAERRIAWGIVFDRASGEAVNQWGRWKRKKRWQNPQASKTGKTNLGTAIGHLRHLLEEALAENVENTIADKISE